MSTSEEKKPWELYYWPSIPGRGEFIRLTLEEAGVEYKDVARLSKEEGGGMDVFMEYVDKKVPGFLSAPPFIKRGDVLLSQTANINLFLAEKYGLIPTEDPVDKYRCHQIALTIADVVTEAHDTHHPVAHMLYYHDQKVEAIRRATEFVNLRIPKWFSLFERALKENKASNSKWLVGKERSYVDLSLYQLLEGLDYAFPKNYAKHIADKPLLQALRKRVPELPRIAAYLKSDRRLDFNEDGIFRKYPELDIEEEGKEEKEGEDNEETSIKSKVKKKKGITITKTKTKTKGKGKSNKGKAKKRKLK